MTESLREVTTASVQVVDGEAAVAIGQVSGIYGVKGWVKVFSYTRPRENILKYRQWYLRMDGIWKPYQVTEGHMSGQAVVAKFAGLDDRDLARKFIGVDIAVMRSALPELKEGEFYWADLEGLDVVNVEGVALGQVDHLLATGASDVMVVRGDQERLIPYVRGQVVKDVDMVARRITVDWPADF